MNGIPETGQVNGDPVPEMACLKFLGTAGARFVVAKQLRASGGAYISARGRQIILDPGPGTIVKCATSRPRIDPAELDGIVLTHAHIDHSNDVNILIDGMTFGGLKKRGSLFAPRECLEGKNAVVLNYLKSYLDKIVILEAEQSYELGDLRFSTSVRHQHPVETYGIKLELGERRISFMVDTKNFPGLFQSYRDSHILVMNVVRDTPFENAEIMHLTLKDVKAIVTAIKPQKTILTHFGMIMLKAKPWLVAQSLSEELGREVIAASDGMTVDLLE